MLNGKLQERFDEIERIVRGMGLNPFDVHFFEVPSSFIWQVAAYGLPTRYSHYSHGKVYDYHRMHGEMGFSKIYELILYSSPSLAFLDKSNSDTINLLICGHCLAHSDFFCNNALFRQCNETGMIEVSKQHADLIDQYRKDYGEDEVDNWIDIAISLERHIDWNKGLYRDKYPKRKVEFEERSKTEWEDFVYGMNKEPLMKKIIKGIHIPPHPERDILWFLSEYANLEEWQRNIFWIVRRESYYFYPQYKTKYINEGFASFIHAETMRQYAMGDDNDYNVKGIKYPLTSEEHLDFAAAHEKVVRPGIKVRMKIDRLVIDPTTNKPIKTKEWNPNVIADPNIFRHATSLNPYYVGFMIFMDIKERWDKYYKQGYMEDSFGRKIPVTINGMQKCLEVRESEDDVSLFRNYLTDELREKLHLFSFGNVDSYDDSYDLQELIKEREEKYGTDNLGHVSIDKQIIANKTIGVLNKDTKKVIDAFARERNNYGVPEIVVRRVSCDSTLRLEHLEDDPTNLDIFQCEHMLKYLYRAWNRPVEIIRKDHSKKCTWVYRYNGSSVSLDRETLDYIEVLESMEGASSY